MHTQYLLPRPAKPSLDNGAADRHLVMAPLQKSVRASRSRGAHLGMRNHLSPRRCRPSSSAGNDSGSSPQKTFIAPTKTRRGRATSPPYRRVMRRATAARVCARSHRSSALPSRARAVGFPSRGGASRPWPSGAPGDRMEVCLRSSTQAWSSPPLRPRPTRLWVPPR